MDRTERFHLIDRLLATKKVVTRRQFMEALEVSPAELIGDGAAPARASRKMGPMGKVRQAFEDVSRLPRRQQEHIVRVVAALVMQYEHSKQ